MPVRSNDVATLRSEHVNARISTGLNHLFPYLNSRDSVENLCLDMCRITGSEHVNSRISTGLNHMFPYLNSRDSVKKFVSRHVSYNWFRTRKFTYFNWFKSPVSVSEFTRFCGQICVP